MKKIFLFLLLACCIAQPVYSQDDNNSEQLGSIATRLDNYDTIIAEQEATYNINQGNYERAQKLISDLASEYEDILLDQSVSGGSPIEIRQRQVRLFILKSKIDRVLDGLKSDLAENESIIEILSTYNFRASLLPKNSPKELLDEITKRRRETAALKKRAADQDYRISRLIKGYEKIRDRVIDQDSKGATELYRRWKDYLVVGKDSIFSSDFWYRPMSSEKWVITRLKSLKTYFSLYVDNAIVHLSVFAALFFITVLFGRFILLKIALHKTSMEHFTKNEKRDFGLFCLGASLYTSTAFVFPYSMGSLMVLGTAIAGFGLLRTSNYIETDFMQIKKPQLSKFAFLFAISGMVISLNMAEKTLTLVYILATLVFLAREIIECKKKNIRNTFLLSPSGWIFCALTLISISGYGRLSALLGLIISLTIFVYALGTLWSSVFVLKSGDTQQIFKGFVRSLAIPIGWGVAVFFGYLWIASFIGHSVMAHFFQWKIGWEKYSISIGTITLVILIFFLTQLSISAFKVSMDMIGSRWPRGRRGAIPSLQSLFTYAIWSIFALVGLKMVGLDLTSIAVVAGGLSVGIGFGMQNIFNNFVSGLILLFGRSIQQGDIIQLGETWCTVRKINIRTTIVETFESALIIIPNSELIATQVINWTRNNPSLRRDIVVGAAYGSNTRKVEEVLLRVAKNNPHILTWPRPYVYFSEFGASSLDFVLRVWIDDIDNSITVQSDIRHSIDEEFRKEDIEIAFPQLDVHIKDGNKIE
ncbi:mechanosensitive ion channel domain-containing protein [Maridesulfovibrio bastinii]|uniref:mechanosensitive ion channel domain-containing protein n=1 Tax=Maridesulfovibrio bastinii TaxID=47157 RepID=UPI0004201589|nr:mechanosensitive ion channel domain-containing protein [Maridesulfovibrio bastinii]